ncbi:MAG: 6-carboxytetrahydropterin synthase [Oscillochloris sp.]|nr:6-carboxytetrahydropterin synthase [Oscillochloris sp.]
MTSFEVFVDKDYTVFCAGHFVTYDGDKCEALHGHNYRAAARLGGELNDDGMVFDFVTLKRLLRVICDRLDHRMLLPRHNARLSMSESEEAVTVRYKQKTYLFPREDVVFLPISNTTAELLAAWMADELIAALRSTGQPLPSFVEVEVAESFGQSALCRRIVTDR